jgi:hypothetical protein
MIEAGAPLLAAPLLAAPLPSAPLPSAPRSHALRPVVVAASLAALHGPTAGLVELPQRLFWSGAERVFDLSDPDRLLEMYEVVFDAARTEADLAEYLHGETLARVWPDLALAPRVRRAWESRHFELGPAVTFAEA